MNFAFPAVFLRFSEWNIGDYFAVCTIQMNLPNAAVIESSIPKYNLIFRYGGFYDGGVWKIHLDSANGKVIANIPLAKTKKNGWEREIHEADLKPVSGKHDLYFTY